MWSAIKKKSAGIEVDGSISRTSSVLQPKERDSRIFYRQGTLVVDSSANDDQCNADRREMMPCRTALWTGIGPV